LAPIWLLAIIAVLGCRSSSPDNRLERLLARHADYGFSGVVLVAQKGRVILERGYGLADREQGTPNTPATLFEMNSLAKTFTAAAVLRLEAEGKLNTSDTIGKFLGLMPKSKASATIDHLATHTAGLVPEGTELDGTNRAAFIAAVKKVPRESPPGGMYRYTNAGYSVLAAIVETAAGDSFSSYIRRHLIEPAGLNSTRFRNEVSSTDSRLAQGYVGTPGAIEPDPPYPYVWGTIGAGGMVSTVGDMYRWMNALRSDKLLSAAQRRKLFQQRPAPREGYGWHVEVDSNRVERIHKGGGSRSFASQILYFPLEDLTICWASNNLVQRWRQSLNRDILAAVSGDSIAPLPPVVRLDDGVLASLAGRYTGPRGEQVEFLTAEHYLYARPNEVSVPADVMFFPQSATEFTGFDPQRREITRLRFEQQRGGTQRATLILPSGQVVALARQG
jgi:CubicO group peptidase (beta-lactamase class C family)